MKYTIIITVLHWIDSIAALPVVFQLFHEDISVFYKPAHAQVILLQHNYVCNVYSHFMFHNLFSLHTVTMYPWSISYKYVYTYTCNDALKNFLIHVMTFQHTYWSRLKATLNANSGVNTCMKIQICVYQQLGDVKWDASNTIIYIFFEIHDDPNLYMYAIASTQLCSD